MLIVTHVLAFWLSISPHTSSFVSWHRVCVIAEHSGYAFVYSQPKKGEHVSCQQVIQLQSQAIYGLKITNNALFVLTDKELQHFEITPCSTA